MTLFKGKYRIQSTRLPGWDYGQAGYYYITICTKNQAHFFGEVVQEDVKLSPMGGIVAEEWLKTEIIRPNVKLDEWIIMPNHMHAIVVITYKIELSDIGDVETSRRGVSTDDVRRGIVTGPASDKWTANTLGSIIGQFKGKCTKRIRAQGYIDFTWQSRFYDRILWTEKALQKARIYIASNPVNWDNDRNNAAGLYI